MARSFLRYLRTSGAGRASVLRLVLRYLRTSGARLIPRHLTRSAEVGQEGPATGGRAGDGEGAEEAGALGALELPLLRRSHEGTKGLETIGSDEATGDEVPQSAFDVGGETAGASDDVVLEEGAASFEEFQDVRPGAYVGAVP
jgi:hypothetical protein